MIYKHELDWYLSLTDKKDSLELMLDDGDLDITGWDIKKCLKLMWKSNGAMLERVQSPIVYFEEKNVSTLLQTYSAKCFSPIASMHHYLGMAKNCFSEIEGKEEIKLKKLFYSLRSTLACKWILEKDAIPPIVFTKMLEDLSFSKDIKDKINDLIKLKASKNESYIHPAQKELNTFIAEELNQAEQASKNLRGRTEKEVGLDALFLEILKNY